MGQFSSILKPINNHFKYSPVACSIMNLKWIQTFINRLDENALYITPQASFQNQSFSAEPEEQQEAENKFQCPPSLDPAQFGA